MDVSSSGSHNVDQSTYKPIYDAQESRLKTGAEGDRGVKVYSPTNLVGLFQRVFGKAESLTIDSKTYIVNKKSYEGWKNSNFPRGADESEKISQNLLNNFQINYENKINSALAELESTQTPRGKDAVAQIDQTYENMKEGGNIDLAISIPSTGTLCVVDGPGHNKPEFQQQIRDIKREVNALAVKFGEKNTFNNEEEAHDLIRSHFKERIAIPISKKYEAVGQQPACIFGQIIKVGDKKMLAVRQASDCCMLIIKKNGDPVWHKAAEDMGLGQIKGDGTVFAGYLHTFIVEEGDEIIFFSDGLKDFMTEGEFLEICKSPDISKEQRPKMCKDKIIENGNKNRVENPQGGLEEKFNTKTTRMCAAETEKGLNQHCKIHNPQDNTCVDDFSIASMVIT